MDWLVAGAAEHACSQSDGDDGEGPTLLAKDRPVRAISALVERLALSAFYAPIKAVFGGPGRSASDPRVLVALWIYACAESVGSARQLDCLCHEHDAFRWLWGGVPVNYHLLADLRVEHGAALDDLMSQGDHDGRGAGDTEASVAGWYVCEG